jgi:virginiamycin B lyase
VFLVVGTLAAAGARGQTITEYPIPTANSNPYTIVTGPDGALWFSEAQGNKVGRITTAGAMTEFPIPGANNQPLTAAAGPDGAIWGTLYGANAIGRMTTAGVATNAFPVPTPNSTPWGLVAGTDGNLYFTESAGNKVARMTTSGVVSEMGISTPNSFPHAIIFGPDGALWFAESQGNKIGRVTLTGAMTEYPTPTANSQPSFLALGSDGAIWFPEYKAARIGRITMAGVITEFPIPTANALPYGIAAGPDGALWITVMALGGDRILRMTTAGVVTNEILLPTPNGGPFGITAGPDGAMWFVENGAGKIGRVSINAGCTPDATTLCLNNARFKVQAQYTTAAGSVETEGVASTGAGQAIALTGDTGYFWFFSSNNVEMIIKVVDGRAVNNKFWVFAAGLTNVNVVVTVTDTQTAAVKTYTNPQGTPFQPIQDTSAFATTPDEAARTSVGDSAADDAGRSIAADLSRLLQPQPQAELAAACTADPITLCLNGGRFRVRVTWATSDGRNGQGQAVSLTADTGYFWFFSSNNVEMIIKVVDGRALNNYFWVFAGGLTNVNVVIEVLDTQTGTVKTYTNPQGTAFQPIQDTSAFPG